MIQVEDYDISLALTPPVDVEEEVARFLPVPVGLLEILCLVGLAGWRNERPDVRDVEPSV